MDPAISFDDLTFTYRHGERPALRRIRGDIQSGGFSVVMGHSGAGKSSLCYTINGLIPRFFPGSYEGRVLVGGEEVARKKVAEMSRRVGLVFQDFEAQLFSTNLDLEVAFGPENLGLPRPEIQKRVERYLAAVGLTDARRREPATLSGGQKQRLAIGSVLAMEPGLLVMDEPTTDLDPQGREEVLAVARSLPGEGRTLFLVEHEPEVAVAADRIWLMREGQLVAQGTPVDILLEAGLLESCGVRPHAVSGLFAAMGWPGTPLTVEDAIQRIERNHLAERRHLSSDAARQARHGGPVLLETEGLQYVYPSHGIRALRGVDFQIREGEFVAILGQNGSGKSTLAKHLNGLLRPTVGRMLVRGKPSTSWTRRELAKQVGYVFQNPDHQIFCRSVGEEVAFGLKALGADPRTIEGRVEAALEVVGLQGREKAVPFALTKGERQRVAVASVLAVQPRVLVLDEPTTGLDYLQQRDMMGMLKRLNRDGHTIIIITHAMWVAAEYADRTIVMKDGSVLMDGISRWVFAQESKLAEASLRPPPLVRLSNWLGTEAVTVEGMVKELRG